MGDYHNKLNSVLMICGVVMFLKVWITLFIQGHKAGKAGNRTAEDKKYIKAPASEETKELALENEKRWRRIVANDYETIPWGFLIFIMATFSVIKSESELGLIVIIPVYTFSRFLHTIFFIYSLQPWRSLIWFIGILAIIAGGLIGVIDNFIALE